jgi:tRNA (cytidine/uridine-2'-O-)-methyltransferase
VVHESLEEFLCAFEPTRLHFFSKRSEVSYLEAPFDSENCLVFGSETKGLPLELVREFPDQFFRIPILNTEVRSLNLASAVAIVTYEALRQTGALDGH